MSNEYITESYNDKQNDNSYYLNFADDNRSTNQLQHQATNQSDKNNPLFYLGNESPTPE